jgi:outer membrane protein OmpA-like peptidoglycan-associated protein
MAVAFGMPASTKAANSIDPKTTPPVAQETPDKFVTTDEFLALFEPDPAEAIKTRGLAKVQRPGLDAKKREATAYIFFETGSARLKSPDSFKQLDAAGLAFKKGLEGGKADKWVIEIAGHTDSVGPARSNQKLSEERAESVRQYLLKTYALPPSAIVGRGYGESNPIARNDTPDGRAKNRRVVFKVTQQAADTP